MNSKPNWKIYRINNSTNEVMMTSDAGDSISFVIPPNHSLDIATKGRYITSKTDEFDANRPHVLARKKLVKVSIISTILGLLCLTALFLLK